MIIRQFIMIIPRLNICTWYRFFFVMNLCCFVRTIVYISWVVSLCIARGVGTLYPLVLAVCVEFVWCLLNNWNSIPTTISIDILCIDSYLHYFHTEKVICVTCILLHRQPRAAGSNIYVCLISHHFT